MLIEHQHARYGVAVVGVPLHVRAFRVAASPGAVDPYEIRSEAILRLGNRRADENALSTRVINDDNASCAKNLVIRTIRASRSQRSNQEQEAREGCEEFE